jgi:hypothetical protein
MAAIEAAHLPREGERRLHSQKRAVYNRKRHFPRENYLFIYLYHKK